MTQSANNSKISDSIAETKANKTNRVNQQPPKKTKKQIGLALLKRAQGASLSEIQKALGWQTHSVRGFLAGTAKKEQGFILNSEKPDRKLRRYRLTAVKS